ncbi:hypothetical protein ACJMK2_036484 [Sinanodonta woodiana]|uniref:Uncharacterized protein n=1 Tax=Sinanodonta woodiana TaxID=1069815 RepID=A0ABD3WKP7_SINWO
MIATSENMGKYITFQMDLDVNEVASMNIYVRIIAKRIPETLTTMTETERLPGPIKRQPAQLAQIQQRLQEIHTTSEGHIRRFHNKNCPNMEQRWTE